MILEFKKQAKKPRAPLAIQGLGLHASSVGGLASISVQGTKTPHTVHSSAAHPQSNLDKFLLFSSKILKAEFF